VAGDHRHDGQGVEQAAVDQHAFALDHRGEQAGNRRRGAHGLVQAAFLKPDFLLVGQVGGHRGKGDRQVFDIDFTNDLADLAEHLLAANRPQAEAHIEQAQHIQIVQALGPLAVVVELASGIDAAHHSAHGAAGDTGDLVAAGLQFFDDTDMRITARPPGTQHQRNALTHKTSPNTSIVRTYAP
jgi:hypothetical protein